MRRGWKIIGWTAGVLVALPALAIGGLIAIGNMGGADWIASRAGALTGGQVVIRGITGTFPTDLRIAEITLSDDKGPWLRADDAEVKWSPLALLRGVAHLDLVTVARLDAMREPAGGNGEGGGGLPLGIEIDALRLERLQLSGAIAGKPATLALVGTIGLASLDSGHAALTARRLDAPGGTYEIKGTMSRNSGALRVAVDEPAEGLIANLAGLPTLGALKVDVTIEGPQSEQRARLAVAAGPLRLDGQGTVDLVGRHIDLAVTGSAPAMEPASDIGWRGATLDARVRGPFTAPQATGQLRLDGLYADGVKADRVTADLHGNDGALNATISLADVTIPGANPRLFAAAPIALQAEARLDAPERPVTFTLAHPLLHVSGRMETGGNLAGSVNLELPALRPLASAAGIDLDGDMTLSGHLSQAGDTTRLAVSGAIHARGGDPGIVRSIGDATIGLSINEQRGLVRLDQLALDSKGIQINASGTRSTAGVLDLSWTASSSALAAFAPDVDGTAMLRGTVKGPIDDPAVAAAGVITASIAGLPRQTIDIGMRLSGVTRVPTGQVTAKTQLAGAPLSLAANLAPGSDGVMRIDIQSAGWKSTRLSGTLRLPRGTDLPLGELVLRMPRLADLQPLIGQDLVGGMTARIDTVAAGGGTQARIEIRGEQIGVGGTQVDRLAVGGTVDRLSTERQLTLNLSLDGAHVGDIGGNITVAARGRAARPELRLTALLNRLRQGEVRVTASATAVVADAALDVTMLQASYGGQTARLVQPAHVDLKNGIAIGDVRLRAGEATMAFSGRVTPALAFSASAENVSASLLSAFAGTAATAAGTISADAKLGGTLAAPTGMIRITGRELRGWTGPGAASAALDATATLHGDRATIDTTVDAGKDGKLTVHGSLPLSSEGSLALEANGGLDLSVFDVFLAANGRRLRGQGRLDVTVSGALAAPQVTGAIRLTNGEVQDYTQGIHITSLSAEIEIADGIARIKRFAGRAGDGTVALGGTIAPLAPGMPVDLTVTTQGAKLPARDLVTAVVDANLRLHGRAAERLDLDGNVRVGRADIQLPDALPKTVAVLEVRRPGQKPEPPSAAPALGLDLTIDAPRAIFVRGHGLDTELGGRVRIAGTAADPSVTGSFALRRGSLDFAGQTLQFKTGTLGFDGRSLTGSLDPTLNFVAEKSSGGVTARIAITGYADDPKIALSSTPALPQDEVLAHLLFARSISELTPIELAQIGSALASLGGGGGFSPLAELRKGLGLDVLSVGGASSAGAGGSTAGATVEAGKYIAEGVFIGSKQSLSGGTRAELKVDLTKRLKLETELNARGGGTVTGASPSNDPGSSVGLTYEFEY